jgi:hypothetical protein
MSHTNQFRRPVLLRLVLDHLGVAPGPVNDLFVVKNLFCSTPDGIYAVQHVLRSLVSSSFKCAINQTIDAEIIIRCSIPSDVESLDGEKLTFKFDDKLVKFYKVVTRVNSTNVLDEGLRIGEIGRRMNSKVRLVEISVYQK